jgi:hypothetical protein
MDKSVRRVTVVHGTGEHRQANVVYKDDDDDDDIDEFPEGPRPSNIERHVRHLLKAQVIAAQDAYQRHLDSVEKGGKSWLFDAPGNFLRSRRKAAKEARKALPYEDADDEDEDKDIKDKR